MADFVLQDNQNVDVAISFADAAGNPVAGPADPGSVIATLASGAEFSATVSADETSVNVRALGPLTTGDVLTVTASVGGVALSGTLAFDAVVGPAAAIGLTPGTPVANS